MWEPVGPLPATVYWRRRWVAVASATTAVLVVILMVSALVTPSDDPATTRAPSRAALSAPQPTSPSPAPAAADPVAKAPPSAVAPSQPGTVGSPASAASSEVLRPDETPRGSGPAAVPVRVPASGPVACSNSMLTVGAEIDRPQHRVGDRPVLRLVITNSSGQPCVRDIDSARQEIVVWNGNQSVKLWSSNDCSNAASTDLRTLVPGQPVAFAVTWAGRTSTPGCARPRTALPPGRYQVLSRLDDIISRGVPFTIAA